jgi:hypothetical protein
MTANVYPSLATKHVSADQAIRQLLRLNVGLAIFMLPIGGTITPNSWSQPFIMMCDIVPFIAVLLGLAQALNGTLPRSAFFKAGLVFVGAQIVSSAVHFSPLGVVSILRILGVLILAETFATLGAPDRAKCEKAIVCIGVFELLLTLFQRVTEKPLAPGVIEYGQSVFLAPTRIPIGSFQFHYTVAALGLLVGAVSVLGLIRSTMPRSWAYTGVSVCAFLSVQSAGRAAALGVASLLFALLFAFFNKPLVRRQIAFGAAALIISSAVGFQSSSGVWNVRAQPSSLKNDSGRAPLYKQAIGMWRLSPVFGVGSGRYGQELSKRRDLLEQTPGSVISVHNVPLFVMTETGVLGLAGMAGFALLLLRRIKTFGFTVALPAAAIAPLLLFDVLHWVIPAGTLQLGVFIGMLAYRNNPDQQKGLFFAKVARNMRAKTEWVDPLGG